MTDITATDWAKPEVVISSDGSPLLPTSPEIAKSRLAALHADPGYVDAVTNPKHPAHQLRTAERAGLLRIAAGASGALPPTPKV
jgi:hypothetical protein